MLSSITPLGERSRRQHFWITTPFLIVGATVAGAVVGAALGAAGAHVPLSERERVLGLAMVGAIGLAADLLLRNGVPTHLRQVDERWLRRYRGWVYGTGYGIQLGLAVATVVTTSTVYVTLLGEALAPTIAAGAVIGSVFGVIRGGSVLLAARVNSPASLFRFHRRFSTLERPTIVLALLFQVTLISAAIGLSL
jgi:hypothetical protein